MAYTSQPAPPRRRLSRLQIILLVVVSAAVLCCSGVGLGALSGATKDASDGRPAPAPSPTVAAPAQADAAELETTRPAPPPSRTTAPPGTTAPRPRPTATRTTRKPAPARTTSAPKHSCDPNYSGACVPIASDVDCAGGSGNGPAYVRGPVKVIGDDIYGLDRDGDGWGCED
ncbi:MAG TPA: hypothetical protein VGJ53_02035 [Micromonosporaceae bacterium]